MRPFSYAPLVLFFSNQFITILMENSNLISVSNKVVKKEDWFFFQWMSFVHITLIYFKVHFPLGGIYWNQSDGRLSPGMSLTVIFEMLLVLQANGRILLRWATVDTIMKTFILRLPTLIISNLNFKIIPYESLVWVIRFQ